MKEEQQLLISISKGDINAFEKIFLQYQPRLIFFLKGMVQDEELGHDMAQDIFMSLWENRHKLAEVDSFSAYLYRIAKCTVYNYYDHQKVCDSYANEYVLTHSSDFTSDEEQLFANELGKIIDKTIEGLSPQRKKIYIMSRKEGKTNDEIAEALNINKRTVENHLTAVLAILRKVIAMTLCIYLS